MLPAMPSLPMLFAVLFLCIANTLDFSFMAARIFRADAASKLTASSVRRSTKCILVLACVVEVAVLFASLRLAADRHALSGDQIETLRDKKERLAKEYRDLKLEIEQIKSDIQSLRHQKEGRGTIRQPATDGIMKSLRAKATKLQQVKISFPWEKLKKAKNIFVESRKVREGTCERELSKSFIDQSGTIYRGGRDDNHRDALVAIMLIGKVATKLPDKMATAMPKLPKWMRSSNIYLNTPP